MINMLQGNTTPLEKYAYYHACGMKGDEILFQFFDLSFADMKEKLKGIMDKNTIKVIGTVQNIDGCINYINNCQNYDVFGCDIRKEDIFCSENPIFVDCTVAFE